MSAIESPLNSAHQHAANADEFRTQGLLIPASEEHLKAAEAFMACVEQSTDSNTKRTLTMLYNEHIKAARELQRKISKLREDNQDPTLPQKQSPPGKHAGTSSAAYPSRPVPSPPPYSTGLSQMSESQNNVDESFMVLGQRSDPGDAFNQFWQTMEGLLDNLSQPVAFATAPLGPEIQSSAYRGVRRDGSSSSDTDKEEPMVARFSKRFGLEGRSRSRLTSKDTSNANSSTKIMSQLKDEFEDEIADEGDGLSESFYLIPSRSENSTSSLEQANAALKGEVEVLQRKLATMERIIQFRKDQDHQLRESIVSARHQAHRAMGASIIQRPGQTIDFSSLNINLPAVPAPISALNAGRDREAQLLRRIRELEEEVRTVRTENEKQKAMISSFRERWEKLKESAKRKKDAKAANAVAKIAARDRIEEEPEAEQEIN